jgi:phosphoserine phosphatase
MLLVISNLEQFSFIKEKIESKYLTSSSIENMLGSYFEEVSTEQFLELRKIFSENQIDILSIPELIPPNQKSFFCFDMDSTLIKEEVIDELAKEKNVFELVSKVTREAMEGGLSFDLALKKRCAHLSGLNLSDFEKVFNRLTPHDGAEAILHDLKLRKAEVAIFSGGFTTILKPFSEKHGIQYYHANQFEFVSGLTTGNILGEIINREKKKDLLMAYREKFSLEKKYTVAVGDGSNDASMILEAGYGIGFHAKQGLKKEIFNWIDFHPLTALLFLFDRNL